MAGFTTEAKTSARKVNRAMRMEQALQLRIAGRTYAQMAAELGYASKETPYRLVQDALADLAQKTSEGATEMRTLETERLTAVVRDADAILCRPDSTDANRLRALELKIKASESLRKLWGLDAPAALDLTSGGAALPSVPELIEALRAAETGEPSADHE
jgi:hypothetical protein